MGHLKNTSPFHSITLAVSLALAAVPSSWAGDILRGGTPAAQANAPAATSGNTTAQAARAQANAADALARTTAAIRSVQAMQASARKVALTGSNNFGRNPNFPGQTLPNVPNGLGVGALQVAPGVPINLTHPTVAENPALWTGARLPTQTVFGGKTRVTIVQTQSQALLNWKTFNIGKKTAVTFNQTAGGKDANKWIAFNQINDPTGNPTQILGSLDAVGQVYLINQNGILFGGSSQVNTRSLIASALPINSNLVNQGLLNNRDAQFLFSALPLAGGASGTPAFNPITSDPDFTASSIDPTYVFQQKVALTSSKALVAAPMLSFRASDGRSSKLIAGTDYQVSTDPVLTRASVTFTSAGLLKIDGAAVTVTYTPTMAKSGNIFVQSGAQLSSPVTAEGNGGRIMLVGANVTNAGSISTPAGQTILASGLQIGISAHASSDPSLRGLDVSVGAVGDRAGTTLNSGLISVESASAILTGKTVSQQGIISGTTSVGLNGRIDLRASYNAVTNTTYDPIVRPDNPPFLFKNSGNVTLGAGSVTQILPELASTQTLASTTLPLRSQINLQGAAIHLAPDSSILAPNAIVSLRAGLWDYQEVAGNQTANFIFTSAPGIAPQIFIDRDATINVAGSAGVSVSTTKNILSVDVRGSQLADSPLQRTGPIRGTTLAVDLRVHGPWDATLNDGAGDYTWVGTPLADARGYRDLIQRSVGELTTGGGSVELKAGGSVVLQTGSLVDVSGGSISYEGGAVQTSRLLTNGQLLDISQATPDRVYDGFYTGQFQQIYQKYGIAQIFSHALALTGSHYEAGYVEGARGGSISITAPAMALDGKLLGATSAGSRQRNEAPAPGSLSLSFQQQDANIQHFSFSPTPPVITFQTSSALPAVRYGMDELGNPLLLDPRRASQVVLSPELLTTGGFGKISIENSDGDIVVPEDVSLTVAAGRGAGASTISLTAKNITIDGRVSAPGGSLNFVVYDTTPFRSHFYPPSDVIPPDPSVDFMRGNFQLGSNAILDTAGLVIDDRSNRYQLALLNTVGGSVSIDTFSANLAAGSIIDVSGGVNISTTGQRTYGKAGSIKIKTGQDPKSPALTGGLLTLGSDLRGYSGSQGGSLSLQATLIQIGGKAPNIVLNEGTRMLDFDGTLVPQNAFLLLQPEFFNSGGFQNFSLTGIGMAGGAVDAFLPAISIAPGTLLQPQARSLVASIFPDSSEKTSLSSTLLPQAQRSGVGLTFIAQGATDFSGRLVVRGDFVLGANAKIVSDPFSAPSRGVSISAQTADILGSISAPGGKISISGGTNSSTLFTVAGADRAVATVHLGRQSVLSAAGASSIYEDGLGYRTGSVFDGGIIQLTGNIIAENGSLLDVSGTSDTLDLSPQYTQTRLETGGINPLNGSFFGRPRIATTVASNAGSIVLQGGQLLYSDATLLGASGGERALGGSLSVSSSIFPDPNIPQTPLDVTLTVQQNGRVLPQSAHIGQPVVNVAGPASGGGHLAVSSFDRGGFDSVTLGGVVSFQGPVSISAGHELHVGDGGVIFANDQVRLKALYVSLGMAFQTPQTVAQQDQVQSIFTLNGPYFFSPTYGAGHLTVTANLIDVGSLSLQGIGKLDLIANNGDIRGNGILDVAGDIRLQSAQVYPTTASSFTIAAYDKNIVVAASSTGTNRVTLASSQLPPGFGVGSALLGSTVASIDGTTVTLQGHASATIATNTPVVLAPGSGSVRIVGSGQAALPLSAGGTLSIYASNIQQGGGLFAPGGTINLGWNGQGATPQDLISGAGLAGNGSLQLHAVNITQSLALLRGSTTSVSLAGALVPFGLNANGSRWIDPSGTDITAGGLPAKAIHLSSLQINDQAGSILDLRGGGDLYSYRWVPGIGGSRDILDSTSVFAIIPGYGSDFAPYAPFNANPSTDNLGGDPGYVSTLRAGEKITLQGGGGLPAGTYTLLPARYALLPGAFLVSPQSGTPVGSFAMPEGSRFVSGYRSGQSLLQRFEIASSGVVRGRAEYQDFLAGDFLTNGALTNNAPAPRLPQDAGYLLFQASNDLALQGSVLATGAHGFHGGQIDISSSSDILISGGKTDAGGIVLDAKKLSQFGAESLLIGGERTFDAGKVFVTTTTGHLTIDNAGSPLRGSDIILTASGQLTVADGARIIQSSRPAGSADTLRLGDATQPGSGDGVLLRVSSDSDAQIVRLGLSSNQITHPGLTVGSRAKLSGSSVILDSTDSMTLDPQTRIQSDHVTIDAGQIAIQLDSTSAPLTGLVLRGAVLQNLETSQSLSLLSYGSIDIYGSGTFALDGTLSLHTSEIRGFEAADGIARLQATSILVDNAANRMVSNVPSVTFAGTLQLDANTIQLGSGAVRIDQFDTLNLTASERLVFTGSGSLTTSASIGGTTPLITAANKVSYSLISTQALTFNSSSGKESSSEGLGARLNLQGSSVTVNSDVILHSGLLSISATGGLASDGVFIGGKLDVSGTARRFFDLIRYTTGGEIELTSQTGDIVVDSGSELNISAEGNAGTLSVSTPKGNFLLAGKLLGTAGSGATSGSFSLDVSEMPDADLLSASLDVGGFANSRSYRVRNGDVTLGGFVRAQSYSLSTDHGSIFVSGSGEIDASGTIGGSIRLVASEDVVLESSSLLTVEGDTFNHAGKGGSISLEAGSGVLTNGVYTQSGTGTVQIQNGAILNLGVKATYNADGSVSAMKVSEAATLGNFTGTLHLRAPQNVAGTDLGVDPLLGTLLGSPSSIVVEGFRIYQPAGGQIDNAEGDIFNNASQFTSNSAAISQRIFGGAAPFAAVITAGAEIVNPAGDLTLSNDWDLSSYRFGPRNAAGVLTMRAAGNLVFNGALSDGFDVNLATEIPVLYAAPLMAYNSQLPANAQSWTYHLSAGSDLSATDFHQVKSLASLSPNMGSLRLGQDYTRLPNDPENLTLIALLEQNVYQVIRTGSGDIDVAVGRDVQLLNPFATIYTAGTQLANATQVAAAGDFELPTPFVVSQGELGAYQEPAWAPQYSLGGGNVTITAQRDIRHQTSTGQADSERQIPTNWLYRRGYVQADGRFGRSPFGEIASTTWWIDFSNFFEGIGTLGGGNVSLVAGRNVENVDAVVATNARVAGKNSTGAILAANAPMVELGGGDLLVNTGGNIDAGIYYVERGQGILNAGGSITTNSTRAPSSAVVSGVPVKSPETTWLPTTLFLGKGSFDVAANGDILLGPVVNAFLAPGGVSNNYQYRTYFSTYAQDDSVEVSSLGGNIDLRENVFMGSSQPVLLAWLRQVSLLQVGATGPTAAYSEPWIRLDETNLLPFSTVLSLLPGTLKATAFTGSINIAGNLTLSPSARGTLEMVAGEAINGLRPQGNNIFYTIWNSSQINLSDADPSRLPGIYTPLSAQAIAVLAGSSPQETRGAVLLPLDALFAESGSTVGNRAVLQSKLSLHDATLLHAGDTEPLRLYASTGNIADFTIFSPKAARILAANDVTDIGLYIQNLTAQDTSVVSAGRDIVAYNPNAPLLQEAQQVGNSTLLAFNNSNSAQSGDIQIGGPGSLQVLAGRNLILGNGRNADLASDLGIGVSTIGNQRNPALPFDGARILLAAGMGGPSDLAGSRLDFASFVSNMLTTANLALYLPQLATADSDLTPLSFSKLTSEEQAGIALDIFYLMLRDAGRSHNDPASPDFDTYAPGYAAIQSLFPTLGLAGDIDLSSRSVKTIAGGSIDILAPGGGLTLGYDIPGPNEVPPGIITEAGGSISIFTDQSVQVGALRIFTLRGGDEIIWSTNGDIAAGNASKTVKTAPPTRVVIDAQTATVETDLAGLATGGGIGVLASVSDVAPGNVDLIAPTGTVDAGDAGIRATGNLNIAAVSVLNADNIQVTGSSGGVPNVVAPTVNLAGLAAASNTTAASSSAASDTAKAGQTQGQQEELPSIISVEVLGYGG
ncbi:MAG: filamentous hemagglutinin family protein [Chthoniobacterales bacterium]